MLEIGPDGFPSTYQSLIANSSLTWDTLDLSQAARLTYTTTSEYAFSIPDNTYDVVLSGQVLEHLRKIWLWMRELTRVCKVEGIVITAYRRHVPGRSPELQPRLLRVAYRVLGSFGFPVECAYDTITIGRKVIQPDRAPQPTSS